MWEADTQGTFCVDDYQKSSKDVRGNHISVIYAVVFLEMSYMKNIVK